MSSVVMESDSPIYPTEDMVLDGFEYSTREEYENWKKAPEQLAWLEAKRLEAEQKQQAELSAQQAAIEAEREVLIQRYMEVWECTREQAVFELKEIHNKI